ncbi:hypothetical protein TRM7557_03705 [Tritonibacter multivorans]|uniref:DUF1476 domain-containing protein n=1 Tax=Tritonibacter multivorans TaxID=928856 RepID=A0A0P1GJ09_9RHOB|nr:DUF1476 domain-containing protein [Tritonibacter multivorans]MDA7421647.1 DUF1476 domain-containing protein [Tritonibacter multivorans]CUH82012.1 hypothetical protein TRM7557_03705 [Tritonibacter multivorans]SFC92824.1 hypothetical protein SAMN04488049_10549 [Tritonibacter multivorans]
MTTFDDREKAFENKFAHDAELKFKIEARRDSLLGLWAAERLGLTKDKAEDYARSVITADLEQPGDQDVLEKLSKDLSGLVDQSAIKDKMAEFLEQATAEIAGLER